MLITRMSAISGITRTLDLDVTEAELKNWENGMLIQYAMPNLTAGEREFLMTGVTDEEWDEMFGEEPEDEY